MRNLEIAKIFIEMANLLEIKGDNPYKIRAYRRGAHAISLLTEDIGDIVREGRLDSVEGIGKTLAAHVQEWHEHGHVKFHEELKAQVPIGLIEVMQLEGVGPKLSKRLYDELGVTNLSDLKKAIEKKRLRELRGLGPKSEANIARSLERIDVDRGRIPLGEALPTAKRALEAVQGIEGIEKAALAGSLRRRVEMVKDIDLVGTAEHPTSVMEAFCSLPFVDDVVAKGSTKSTVLLHNGMSVDLRLVPNRSYPSVLHHFTGSKEHNVILRERAQRQGYSISEYGLKVVETGEMIYPESEAELYEKLGLAYIPPELREGSDEIEAAASGKLPNLVELDDIKGDLHVHTNWSDGRASILQMAQAAKELGREYVAICDHSQTLRIAGGLSADDLKRQWEAIDEVQAKLDGIRILKGIEVDILNDGRLDLDDRVLEELDVVVASIHSGLRQDKNRLTERIVQAMRNPHVDIIGHPTGRIIGRRSPYDVDIDRVIQVAKETKTALEINASPKRLDLKDSLARKARDAGVLLVVNTDAHEPDELSSLHYGVSVARRAWCKANDLVNTRPLEELMKWLSRRE